MREDSQTFAQLDDAVLEPLPCFTVRYRPYFYLQQAHLPAGIHMTSGRGELYACQKGLHGREYKSTVPGLQLAFETVNSSVAVLNAIWEILQ